MCLAAVVVGHTASVAETGGGTHILDIRRHGHTLALVVRALQLAHGPALNLRLEIALDTRAAKDVAAGRKAAGQSGEKP